MATNFITCDAYQFMNFSTGEIVEFRALTEGSTRGWTLEEAVKHLLYIYGEDYPFAFLGHVEREYNDAEYSPEDFEDDEDDEEPLDDDDWDDDDWDDDWSADYNGPAWCEETGWYE